MSEDPPELNDVALACGRTLGFTDVQFCSRGAFKETYRVRDSSGTFLALKIVDRSKINFERTEREISALQRCSSPHIARLLRTIEFPWKEGVVYDIVVEEFIDGGTLGSKLNVGCLSKPDLKELLIGLASAIDALATLRLVHRDIKPENIMFRGTSNAPVLVDFGLVRDLTKVSVTASWAPRGPGTPLFSSPEQLNNEKEMIDWRSDQFAIGIVGAFAAFGQHPFKSKGMTDGDAVIAVAERRNCDPDFVTRVTNTWLEPLLTMIRPFPVQRYCSPKKLLLSLTS